MDDETNNSTGKKSLAPDDGGAGSRPAILEPTCDAGLSTESPYDGTVPSGCTVFTLSKGEQVFFGGNDDYINPDNYYWIDPGDTQNYGAIWIGQPDNVQQGVKRAGPGIRFQWAAASGCQSAL